MLTTGLVLILIRLLFIRSDKHIQVSTLLNASNPKTTLFTRIRDKSKKGMALLFFALFFTACSENKQVNTIPLKDYNVLTMEPRTVTTYTDFPATIQGENIVEIRPMVDGYLEAIYVKEGATVKKGQLLFKIKNSMFEQAVITANAAIKNAQADVNTAKMNVEKVRPLVEKEIVSNYELQSALFTLQSKEAALSEAKATLANANTNLGYTTLRSPQNGVIGAIPYKIGALVNSTTSAPLTVLADITHVYAYFSWNEKQLLTFFSDKPGKTIQEKLNLLPPVTLVLADGTEYSEKGKLETASGLINTETGTASFKAIFPNPRGIIHSGSSALVRLNQTKDDALLVPQSASYEMQDKRFVYLLASNNMVMSRSIDSRPTNDGQFLIVLNGLKSGDKVLLGGTNLKDSTFIIPKYIKTDSIYSQLHNN